MLAMTRAALILWIFVGLCLIALIALVLTTGTTPKSPPEGQGNGGEGAVLPSAEVAPGAPALPRARSLEELLLDPSTIRLGPDDYLFAQTEDSRYEVQEFQITYHAPDETFTLSLMAEPLGKARREAEMAFLAMLGLSETRACALRVIVAVPWDLSERYAGQNLGMSFCRGAIALPEE